MHYLYFFSVIERINLPFGVSYRLSNTLDLQGSKRRKNTPNQKSKLSYCQDRIWKLGRLQYR